MLVAHLRSAGGGIENWFAYVLALVFLLVRPQGLFGERIIERVYERPVFYREAGQFQTSYAADQAMFPIARTAVRLRPVAFAFVGVPLFASEYLLHRS